MKYVAHKDQTEVATLKRISGQIRPRRAIFASVGFISAIACVAAVAMAPFLFPLLDQINVVDWARLSDIGQAYGGVSALIATIGVFGVAASLLGQVREARRAGIRDERQLHAGILLFAIEHPEYLQCWGGYVVENNGKATSYRSFCNLVFLNYYSMFLSGQYNLEGVRHNIAHFFEGQLGREYWTYSRNSWLARKGGGRRRQAFLSAVEEEFKSACAAGPAIPYDRTGITVDAPPSTRGDHSNSSRKATKPKTSADLVMAGIGGIALGVIGFRISRRLHSRRGIRDGI